VEKPLNIGALARATGTKVETIRWYERVGLLPAPARSAGNYRTYGEAHLGRLSFIRRARDLGFSLEQIRALKAEGVRVVMLTGDNRTTAEAVARRLGITEVEAEVLPEDKQRIVERLKAEGRRVAMAGDGVNDAPALAAAEVGIAMGTGTDVAIESAGVTLLRGDLTGIVRARRLSRAVMRNIRENLFFAFAYNAAGVPVAAGVLYPFFGILLSPLIAAAPEAALRGSA